MIYDVIIVGSGPAGLSAAIYAMRAQLSALVLEKEGMSGGQMLNTHEVDNYPGLPEIGGYELGLRFREHAEKLGAQFFNAEVKHIAEEEDGRVKVLYTNEEEFRAKAVVLAMGAHVRKLGIPGEQELTGMGVSYCATCDGAFFKGRTVAVVGGGDSAVEDALYLARICAKVYIILRRDEFRAEKLLQKSLRNCENVEILFDTQVTEIHGEDHVECVTLRNSKDGTERILDLDGVFIAVGMIPNTLIVKNLLRIDDKGYIFASEDGVTEKPGFFAAGDVRTKHLRQIVTAVADGANVISSVENYLKTL